VYAPPASTSQALPNVGEALTKMASAPNPWILLFVPLPALLFAASARAEPGDARKVRLEYVREKGAEDCPGEEALLHVIRHRTKDNPFSPTAKASLRVVVTRVGQAFQGRYELRDEEGKLLLELTQPEHSTCAVAVEAVGFSVSLFMPTLLTAKVASSPPHPDPSPPPDPPPPPRPCPPPLPEPPLLPPPDPPQPWRLPPAKPREPIVLRAHAGAVLSSNPWPKATGGFSAHVEARWWSFSLSLGARHELPVSTDLRSIGRTFGEAVPCVHTEHVSKFPIDFSLCGLFQYGELSIWGQAPDADITKRKQIWWAGGRFAFGPIPPSSPVTFVVYVDYTVPTNRETISVLGIDWAPGNPTAFGASVVYRFYSF
jgi:hypothetical protein